MRLIDALGLNWKILLAQLINFAILVWVLHRFGYGPFIKFLDSRRKKIEEGLRNKEVADKKLLEVGEKEKEILTEAKKEAQRIITSSGDLAEKNRKEILEKAEEDARQMFKAAQTKAEMEKKRIISEAREEVAGLVVMAVEKLIDKKMDSEEDRKFIERIIADAK